MASVEVIKTMYQRGLTVRCDYMENEPQMAGKEGIVDFVDDAGQIHVKWYGGGSLALIPDVDKFEVIK